MVTQNWRNGKAKWRVIWSFHIEWHFGNFVERQGESKPPSLYKLSQHTHSRELSFIPSRSLFLSLSPSLSLPRRYDCFLSPEINKLFFFFFFFTRRFWLYCFTAVNILFLLWWVLTWHATNKKAPWTPKLCVFRHVAF